MQPGSRLVSSTATSFFTGSFELADEVKTLEDYVVGQRLGEGAYGSVYVVKYIPSGDRFALKILQKQDLFTGSGVYSPVAFYGNGEMEEDQQQQSGAAEDSGPLGAAAGAALGQPSPAVASIVRTFEQNIVSEAMVMQSLEHPHVVKFFKFLNSTTAFYFVLELAEGGELFDLILSKNYFAEDEARTYFQQLISAIDYCHRNGVAHKDLKAENLLLSNDGRLLVCDFGFSSKVAKENIDDPEETVCTGDNTALLDAIHNGSVFGTLHYTSPEAVLASSQQRDFDHLSCDDGDGSVRFGSALADTTFANGRSGFPSQADMTGSPGAGPICSSPTPVSTSSSDSPQSSRSGSTRPRQHRHHMHRMSTAGGASHEGGAAGVLQQNVRGICGTPPCQPGEPALERRGGMRRAMSGCVDEEVTLVKTALEVASSSGARVREGLLRPTPLTPPPTANGANNMRHSSSTQSLSSLTNCHGKVNRKTSPTLGRNKVSEGFSSFVKALLGTGSPSGSGHHHHHHREQQQQQHSDAHGSAKSLRDKEGQPKSATTVVSTASGKTSHTGFFSPVSVPGDGNGKAMSELKAAAAPGAHTSVRIAPSSQEPASVLSSAVSSTTTSPTTASFNTNPSFADSAGRTGASVATSAASASRRSALPQTSSSPATRVAQTASEAASATRLRANNTKEADKALLTAKSSAEELSGQTSSSHGTATSRQRLPLSTEPRPADVILSTEQGSPVFASTVTRKPPLVIVDPFQQDLWSAGVILFFMLTGRLPFDGRDEEETLHLIQTNDFAFDEDEVQRISPAARQLVNQMLAAEPTDRPTTEQIIHNAWFRVDINFSKDFPHREDLLEPLSSPTYKGPHRLPTTQQAAAGSPASSSPAQMDGGNRSGDGDSEGSTGRVARKGAGSSDSTLRSGTAASNGGTPVTHVPQSGTALFSVVDGSAQSSSCHSGHSTASALRRDKANSFTFLDFSTRHPVSAEEERVLATAFRKVDSDGFGCITRDQLRDMLTTLHGDAVPTSDVDELVRLFTGDARAEQITFSQFRDAWVSKDLAHTQFTHSSEFQLANIIGTEMDAVERQVVRQLRTAFDSLDENHRGVIQLDQVRRVFDKCHIPVSREDCLSLIKYFHETELARGNTRASKNWNRGRVTPAVTPTTNVSSHTSGGAASLAPSPLPGSPFSVTAASLSCAAAAASGEAWPGPNDTSSKDGVNGTPRPETGVGMATDAMDAPLTAPAGLQPPLDSPATPFSITVSFDSFVSGIVKSDILMKHPLGRKLAAATNLAAMFQSRNVTECVRHGFLVTGLQNVVLAKLASLPERLLLLYSDEVVSTTENIYSFRYLGSSALVTGATMSSATPLLMSASLVAITTNAGGGGPLGGASLGNSAQLATGLHGGMSASHRSNATTPPSSSSRRFGQLNRVTGGTPQSHGSPGLVATPSLVAEMMGGGDYVCADSNAGSLPYNSAPTVASVNRMLSGSSKSGLRKPSSRVTLTPSNSLGSPPPHHDCCPADPLASSSASSQPPSQQQRSAAVPIPRPPSHQGAATTSHRSATGASANACGRTQSASHSPQHSPSSYGARSATGAMRDRRPHKADNDDDSAQDDTHSFFSASRHSSSIINTSEETQSASDTSLSVVQGEEQDSVVSAVAAGRRRKSTNETVAPKGKGTAHIKAHAGQAMLTEATRDSPATVDGMHAKRKLSTTTKIQSTASEAASHLSSAAAKDADASPSATSSAPPRAPSPLSTPRLVACAARPHVSSDGAKEAEMGAENAAQLALQQSSATLTSSLQVAPSTTLTSAGYSMATPSANFTHRAMAYGGTGAVAQVNGVCDVDVILSPACLGYTMVQFRRIHGKTSDFHEAVTFISNLLESEREQAMEDTLTRGESELM